MKIFTDLLDRYRQASKEVRAEEVGKQQEMIYNAFYTSLNLTDIERAQMIKSLTERIKMDIRARKEQSEQEYLTSEQALDLI
jgi:hypothetical protein